MSFLIKNKRVAVDINNYFKLVVLKELKKHIKKVPATIISKKLYEGSYKEYQREYQKRYYHTHKKALRKIENE